MFSLVTLKTQANIHVFFFKYVFIWTIITLKKKIIFLPSLPPKNLDFLKSLGKMCCVLQQRWKGTE